ncbi:MAG: RrF2 family transcriptional regulator [Anaerolineae bacterium]
MKLSAKERTALRAMAELARRYGQGPIALNEIASSEGLTLPYLERIAMDLRKAGLVTSTRGAHGGYCLARSPEVISIGDVIRSVEHSLMLLDCAPGDGSRHCHEAGCAAHLVLEMIARRLEEALDGTSLASITNQSDGYLKG